MTTVTVNNATEILPELLERAVQGEEIVIAGKTHSVQLVPIDRPRQQLRIPDLYQGRIWMSDDFNEPLPDEFWTSGTP